MYVYIGLYWGYPSERYNVMAKTQHPLIQTCPGSARKGEEGSDLESPEEFMFRRGLTAHVNIRIAHSGQRCNVRGTSEIMLCRILVVTCFLVAFFSRNPRKSPSPRPQEYWNPALGGPTFWVLRWVWEESYRTWIMEYKDTPFYSATIRNAPQIRLHEALSGPCFGMGVA